jgi:hypothetical protein
MANNEETYHQTIMRMRLERNQREHHERLQNTQAEYVEAARERDEAAARGDLDGFELADTDCERLEQDWAQLCPQQRTLHPAAREFLDKHRAFRERYGQRADQAIVAAHQYATRPRNPNATNPANNGMGLKENTPAYFRAVTDLLEMYGPSFYGIRFDHSEAGLTPNEAAKISGVSANTYNRASQELARQGRFDQWKK